jgi:hypothetical protein
MNAWARLKKEIISFAGEQLVPLCNCQALPRQACNAAQPPSHPVRRMLENKSQGSAGRVGCSWKKSRSNVPVEYLKAASDGDKNARLSWLLHIVYLPGG